MMDLDPIRARCEAATEGPWFRATPNSCVYYKGPAFNGKTIDWEIVSGGSVQDHEFIAHARTDLPACVKEIQKLRRRVADLEEELCQGVRAVEP